MSSHLQMVHQDQGCECMQVCTASDSSLIQIGASVIFLIKASLF